MSRPTLEVADIFRDHGPAWRQANAGHVSLDQLKVMSAIERCRTAALGGHVVRCQDCSYTTIAYNSCRNRHCPKCQSAAAREWLAEREAELLPVPYFHVVFTLPARIADIAYQNKAVVYDLLFKASSEAVLTIAADPEHLGARIGITAVLHTWGSPSARAYDRAGWRDLARRRPMGRLPLQLPRPCRRPGAPVPG
jgi:predicted Zn-ribbon and HTH transcriptional regulator